jgi:hypothetical protein
LIFGERPYMSPGINMPWNLPLESPLTTDLRTMVGCWMGDETYKAAIVDKRLQLVGPSALTRNIQHWIADSIFAGIPPAREI